MNQEPKREIFFGGCPHVIVSPLRKHLHGHQPGPGVHKKLPDMSKIGDTVVEQYAVGGMCDGFVKRPISALRFPVIGFNVPWVRLAISRLARLASMGFSSAFPKTDF